MNPFPAAIAGQLLDPERRVLIHCMWGSQAIVGRMSGRAIESAKQSLLVKFGVRSMDEMIDRVREETVIEVLQARKFARERSTGRRPISA